MNSTMRMYSSMYEINCRPFSILLPLRISFTSACFYTPAVSSLGNYDAVVASCDSRVPPSTFCLQCALTLLLLLHQLPRQSPPPLTMRGVSMLSQVDVPSLFMIITTTCSCRLGHDSANYAEIITCLSRPL